jgi:hypothetical protein
VDIKDLLNHLNILSDIFNDLAMSEGLLSESDRMFQDSPADAFRHAGSSMLLEGLVGEDLAALAGALNEYFSDSYSEQSTVMDHFNNHYGRELSRDFDHGAGAASTGNGIDRLANAVRDGITINSINDPRIRAILDNLLPRETVYGMMERTGGVIAGPSGMEYDLRDPRGLWQDPGMVHKNLRDSLGPDSSIRPRFNPLTTGDLWKTEFNSNRHEITDLVDTLLEKGITSNLSSSGQTGSGHDNPTGILVVPGSSGPRIPGLGGGGGGDSAADRALDRAGSPSGGSGSGGAPAGGTGGTGGTGHGGTGHGGTGHGGTGHGGTGHGGTGHGGTGHGGTGHGGTGHGGTGAGNPGAGNMGGAFQNTGNNPGNPNAPGYNPGSGTITGGGGTGSGGTSGGNGTRPPQRTPPTGGHPALVSPILLDLDGDGVQITEFGNSSQFTPGTDGLQHRSS